MAATGGFAFALAAHQHFDTALERVYVLGLRGDDRAEIIDGAFEMGDFFSSSRCMGFF